MPLPSPLLPTMDEDERRGLQFTFYEWECLEEAGAERVSILPGTHPFVPYLPKGWHQGDRGTCVGHACAIWLQCNYYALTQDFPTHEEINQALPDQTLDLSSCIMTFDKWYRTVFSPQWCYHVSRVIGNITYPSGSYCSAAADAMRKAGGVAWDECLTPKSPFCVPTTYPHSYDDTKRLAERHILDGFAKVSTWRGIMDAIATSPAHCIIMPINVYDIPPDSKGNLRSGGNPSGSHALPWLFVDYSNKRIGCWNSWGLDYPQVTWIDEAYWRENGGPAFVSLDKQEVIFAQCVYSRVAVSANIPCQFAVNGEVRPEGHITSFAAQLESFKDCTITATPGDTTIAAQTKTFTPKAVNESVVFTFGTSPGNTSDNWWQTLLKKLLAMIRRRSGEPAQASIKGAR